MKKLTIRDVDVKGKKVLVRCDFNVPQSGGVITDDNRIKEALPTIQYLLQGGAKVVLCSHLGRPKGKFDKKYTLQPVADRLSECLGSTVVFCDDVIGKDAQSKVAALQNGQAILLENLRFHAEEEANDKEFSRALAGFCDIFVNDAFGTAHRAHASTAGVVQHGFVKTAVAGFLMEKEIEFLSSALENPKRPFVAILGGAKVSDKIGVVENLIGKVDCLLIGGGMAYTFLAAAGGKIGSSLCETDKMELAARLMAQAKDKGVKLLLPVDVLATCEFPNPIDAPVPCTQVSADNIPDGYMGLDIGQKTRDLFAQQLRGAKTVVWNGPMGVFENPSFAGGTLAVATAVADCGGVTVIGGGDSAAAIISLGLKDKITHVSTGGGASLEMLEGKEMPAVDCLTDKK